MTATIVRQLNLKGLSRPLPIIRTAQAIRELRPGEMVEILATDAGSVPDFWAWCYSTSNALMESSRGGRRVSVRGEEEVTGMEAELQEELEELDEEERLEREQKATVLLVAPGSADRDRIGGWLEEAGYEVMACPGPQDEHDCVGLLGGRCPLAFGADAVVLDMGPGDDPSGPVLPGWHLLELYSGLEVPLVAVVPWGVLVTEDPVVPVGRPVVKEELLGAVARSLSGRFVSPS